MVRYQYFSYFWYCEDTPALEYSLQLLIHLQQLSCFIMIYCKPSRNFAFLTNFECVPLWYFLTQLFAADNKIHNLPIFDHPQNSTTTERQSSIRGWLIVVREIKNRIWFSLIQVNFRNTLLYPTSVRNCPRLERGIFYILIIDLTLRSAPVGFSLLCAIKYYYKKGPFCYVLTFYIHYWYGELSILFLFIFSQKYTCVGSFYDIVH